jgi:hypothetical protein
LGLIKKSGGGRFPKLIYLQKKSGLKTKAGSGFEFFFRENFKKVYK